MRLFLAFVPLALAACNINSDANNEQVTLEYNKQQIRDTAVKARDTAKNLARGIGNVAGATGRAISNEVGDVDVDVNVKRTPLQRNAQ